MTVVLKDTNRGTEKEFDSVAEAKEKKQDMVGLGASPEDFEIEKADTVDVEHIDHTAETDGSEKDTSQDTQQEETTENVAQELPEQPPVDTDPLEWIPAAFQDTIDGTVAINRKGFEVLAQHYGIEATTEMVVSPVETDGEYCIHMAVAITPEGEQYSAYGEAYRDEEGKQMVRMSDTRSYKRAVSRATGTGMLAVEELQSNL